MIKAILFDMGGVVCGRIDNIRYVALSKLLRNRLSWKEVERSVKIHEHKFDKGLISPDEFWKSVASSLKIRDCNQVKRIYVDTMTKRGIVKKSIIQLVRKLKKKGYKTGILSNTCLTDASIHKKRGDYDSFSPVILSYEIGYRKPEKEIYQIALKKLKVKPKECVFIDNKERNLKPARKLGIKTILFQSVKQFERELNKLL